jgi:hypothetical protein
VAATAALPVETAQANSRLLRRSRVWLFVIVLAIYGTAPIVTNGDPYLTVPTAYSVLRHGDLNLDEYHGPRITSYYSNVVANGHHYDYFPWTVSLFALPAVIVVSAAHVVGIGRGVGWMIAHDHFGGLSFASGVWVTALAVLVMSVFTYERLNGDERRKRRWAFIVGLAIAFGTSAFSTASRALWQHGPSILLTAAALLVLHRILSKGDSTPRGVLLGTALGAAYTVRPTNAVVLAVVVLWLLVARRSLLAPFATGAAAVFVPWVVVNVLSFHSVLPAYFSAGRVGYHAHFFEAIGVNLISPARGLFVFSPIAILSVIGAIVAWRRRKLDTLLVMAAVIVVVHTLGVSGFPDHWWGGHSYGPRFMSDMIPFLLVLAVPAIAVIAAEQRRAWSGLAGAALAVSVVANAQGAYLRAAVCWNADPADVDLKPSRVWDWGDAQVTRGIRRLATRPLAEAVRGRCPNPGRTGNE